MSNVNIKRAVENIRSGTNVYTPIIEVIVNSIQAIEETDSTNEGRIDITILRSAQNELDNSENLISGFVVSDNGVGFTEKNRTAFDTLYTDNRISQGGKGFGRFTCLKYFSKVLIESIYFEEEKYFERKFQMGESTEIIVNESIDIPKSNICGTKIKLTGLKTTLQERTTSSISRTLVEKLLPFFIDHQKKCPLIFIKEEDGTNDILLNNYLNNQEESLIHEFPIFNNSFLLKSNQQEESFTVRLFKVFSSKLQRSKISLVAHRREVTTASIHNYIPEFIDEFYENTNTNDEPRNFIIKVYVFGSYLDNYVSLERGGFEFQKDNDLLYGISQTDIEKKASEFAREPVRKDVMERSEKKRTQINEYVDNQAPWYKGLLNEVEISDFPYNPSFEQIDQKLHLKKYQQEVVIRAEVNELLASDEINELKEKATEIVSKISGSSRNELIHYIALRRSVLDIFDKSLSVDSSGKYSSEEIVHNIIFPTKSDSDSTSFDNHNLWIIDERLNFTQYLTSDKPLNGQKSDRPDLLIFDKRIGFRGDNEPSNPVTIFEFKKPHRDDFTNPSSSEDPIEQIIRYVIQLKEGKYKTPEGREIRIEDNTPFYGFVICELTNKVKTWLEDFKDFKPMPDRMGYFGRHSKLNLYIEVLSWEKVLKDANMRNKVFFHKLGIS